MGSLRVFAKTALFTVLVPGTIAVAIPQLLSYWRPHPKLPVRPGVARVLGGLSLVTGGLLYVHTAFRFGTEGDGTPSPTDEPETLVTGGVYAFVRNPMYVAVIFVIIGQALRQRSTVVLWWAAGCWIGFHNRVIGYEEPHLAEKHGETFERYREDVPRWIPRHRK